MRFDYLVPVLLWAAYCAVHSALISTRATRFFKGVMGTRYSFHRLFFNAFSLITLIPLVMYSHSPRFQGSMLLTWSGNWRIVQYLLVFVAAALFLCGARHYSMSRFLGLEQIRSNRSAGALTKSGEPDTTGVLGFMRHPWYLAVFILLWARGQNAGTIIINAVLSAYLVIGTFLEERKLVFEFGDEYRKYQERVSMFIPLKWLKLKHK